MQVVMENETVCLIVQPGENCLNTDFSESHEISELADIRQSLRTITGSEFLARGEFLLV